MALQDKKTEAAGFSNKEELRRVTYDFAEDGGSQGDYDIYEAQGAQAVRVKMVQVEDALTSGGSAVIDCGKGDGGAEYLSDEGFASFSAGAVVNVATSDYVKLADGEKIVMGIEAADLTAGKMVFLLDVVRF